MAEEDKPFKFEFALAVLNLLGRGLYRNFATVVAEAISNSWDAEATEVCIKINKDEKTMEILDNGKGMDWDDFQDKFMHIGYSRREDKSNQSKRTVLGRKGIGKLAMLSIAERVTVQSKKEGGKIIGGTIDNATLDKIIERQKLINQNEGSYSLEPLKISEHHPKLKADGTYIEDGICLEDTSEPEGNERIIRSGTCIKFEGIKDAVNNPDLIKSYMAVQFNFPLFSPSDKFDIYVNGAQVTPDDLEKLNQNTEYFWPIGLEEGKAEEISDRYANLKSERHLKSRKFVDESGKEYHVNGYIASVTFPKYLTIRGSKPKDASKESEGEFRTAVSLFVSGRLRQENVLKDVEASTTFVDSYLYGEIHVNELDNPGDKRDIFTSSREGIIKDDPLYMKFLDELDEIRREVYHDWRELRNKGRRKFVSKLLENYPSLKEEKRVAIGKLFDAIGLHDDDDDDNADSEESSTEENEENAKLKRKMDAFLKQIIPQESGRKVLICHNEEDKDKADIIEKILHECGFTANEIIYTSSDHAESKVPFRGKNRERIFKHIKKFFVQDMLYNPAVIFVHSKNMQNSWGAIVEVGAAWITTSNDFIVRIDDKDPKPPLKGEEPNLVINEKGYFKDWVIAHGYFEELAKNYGKRTLSQEELKELLGYKE